MTYIPGKPQLPIIIFLDGSGFEVFGSVNTIKDGKPAKELILSPFEWTKAYLKILDTDMDFKKYAFGTLTRIYSSSRIIEISNNPEKPIWLGLCSFHGTDTNTESGELMKILTKMDEIESLQARIDTLQKEIIRLRRENNYYAMKAREFFETQQQLTQPRTMFIPEAASEGEIEIKRKVSQE